MQNEQKYIRKVETYLIHDWDSYVGDLKQVWKEQEEYRRLCLPAPLYAMKQTDRGDDTVREMAARVIVW